MRPPGRPDSIAAIAAGRLLPVLRLPSADAVVAAVRALAGVGHPVVELTTSTAGWPDAVRACRSTYGGLAVGVGTVTSAELADRAVTAGADFLVSPYPCPAVRPIADDAGVPFIEGGFTPREVAEAVGRGVVKLFPAHVGGVRYLRSLLAVLPEARIVPTGGVALSEVREWLAAGAYAVGVGRDLFADSDEGLAERIAEALGREAS